MKRRTLREFLHSPLAPYYIITFSVLSLSSLGLVMVLSASSVKSLQDYGSVYAIFLKQLGFLIVAFALGWLATHLKVSLVHTLARKGAIIGALALALPIAIGKSTNGNKNWIPLGPITIQPSEFAKLLLILWIAAKLTRAPREGVAAGGLDIVYSILPGTLLFLGLIMAGKDLGTALIVMSIAGALLFVGGLRLKYILSLTGGAVIAVAGFVITQPNRLHRFAAVLNPFSPSVYKFAGWQPAHSVMGLASGGLFGVGIGASQQKWANLSEAHTDFIFSVIGEELGLLGTLFTLFLFGLLLYGIFRAALQIKDHFFRFVAAGVGAWLLVQVVVNVGSDIGLFPVVGVTLPFISYGGSSLLANYMAVGVVLNALRRNPETRAHFANKVAS